MVVLGWILLFLAAALLLLFHRATLSVWCVATFVFFLIVSCFSQISIAGLVVLWLLALLVFVPLMVLPLRRQWITRYLLSAYRRAMPTMSMTEQEALQAGTVGWEAELFTGMPDWQKLRDLPRVELTAEESEFLSGPVSELCGMIDNWVINHEAFEIPQEIWQFLKEQGFFGLIIPKEYGGKGFSALAHSQIIIKVASVSVTVGIVVSVPNSLGPAELLLEYGTVEQKDLYLPRLAKGKEIPCFALTSPIAGSDASAIEDTGVVCQRVIDGKETLGVLLNWDKRYITLAPVATLVGLAFKLYDPNHLIGTQENLGITCALIAANTPGVEIGRRHFPLCSHFPNGPTRGKDVFIPIDWIIGGQAMAGCGWRMLMECLAAGRSISLPSMVTGGSKKCVFASGAYARIRRQFNTSISRFGGIQEALARIASYTYLIEALRLFSVTSIDRGEKSAVASAICKCHTTELARQVSIDAMDLHGGKGICMGPKNYLAQSFIENPISITVEGANILTRSMIIFGQGAIRAHPYVLKEMQAARQKSQDKALHDFDLVFFKHVGMMMSNRVRAFCLAITSGRGARAPSNELKRYYQHFSRFSAAFSFVADVAMISIGSKLKRKECLSARLGDMLSYLYMGSAVLKHYEQQGDKAALPVVEWVCQELLLRLQNSLHGFLLNMPKRWLATILRLVVFPLGRRFSAPKDRLSKAVVALFDAPSSVRDQLTQDIYKEQGKHHNPIAKIDEALSSAISVEPLLQRLHQAERKKQIHARVFSEKVQEAVATGVLSEDEGEQLVVADALRMEIIHVDDFAADAFRRTD